MKSDAEREPTMWKQFSLIDKVVMAALVGSVVVDSYHREWRAVAIWAVLLLVQLDLALMRLRMEWHREATVRLQAVLRALHEATKMQNGSPADVGPAPAPPGKPKLELVKAPETSAPSVPRVWRQARPGAPDVPVGGQPTFPARKPDKPKLMN